MAFISSARAFTHPAWADDKRFFSTSCQSLERMMRELAVVAETEVGLEHRWDKCSVALAAPHLPQTDGYPAMNASHPLLSRMTPAAEGTRFRLLGATLQVGSQCSGEFDEVQRKCWVAFHMRRSFWRTRAHAFEKMRMLHMCVFLVLSWCSASRFWNRQELAAARTMQALNSWPRQAESIDTCMKRAARWCARQSVSRRGIAKVTTRATREHAHIEYDALRCEQHGLDENDMEMDLHTIMQVARAVADGFCKAIERLGRHAWTLAAGCPLPPCHGMARPGGWCPSGRGQGAPPPQRVGERMGVRGGVVGR